MFEEIGGRTESLTGWGRTAPSAARYVEPDPGALPRLIARAGSRGVIARGLGRSYGDAAQNAGGDVIGPLPSRIALDRDAVGGPVVRVSAGTRLHDLIEALLPTGHFVTVTPGTRQVTVGGSIAADVHGKNHHREGSFGEHVVSLDLMGPDGTTRTVGPGDDVFAATVGGMGLTGVVTAAEVRVKPVGSGWMRVRTERIPDLAALMARMRATDDEATYSVAWIDTLATGHRLGRSVLTLGEHAAYDELDAGARAHRWTTPGAPLIGVPPVGVPPHLMSRTAVRAFNAAWFRKAPTLRVDELQTIAAFFHPLDHVARWNRLYGRAGFVQYQLVLPDAAEDDLPRVLERIARAGHPSFLSVLKRFGPQGQGLLSFPLQGWTLALDVPTHPGLRTLFAELDRILVERGGRVYLAKDSRTTPEAFAAMYPRLDHFREIAARVDPDGVFQSDLSRRLRIREPKESS